MDNFDVLTSKETEAVEVFEQLFLRDLESEDGPITNNRHLMRFTGSMIASLFVRWPELMYNITVNSVLGIGRDDEIVEDYKKILEIVSEQGMDAALTTMRATNGR